MTSELSYQPVTLERVIWTSSITRYACNSPGAQSARRACHARVAHARDSTRIAWKSSTASTESIFTRLTCYTHRAHIHICACTDFNGVIYCAKTKLDNFIAMALAPRRSYFITSARPLLLVRLLPPAPSHLLILRLANEFSVLLTVYAHVRNILADASWRRRVYSSTNQCFERPSQREGI